MTYKHFTATLQNQIASLSPKRRIESALKICKELFFDYQNFYEVHKWGNPDLLLDGINLSEKSLYGNVDFNKIQELIHKIESITPDMDDFGSSEHGSYALNAAAAVFETLQFVLDKDATHIVNICSYYTDTIDMKIQVESENDLSELQIDEHRLMIKARQFLLGETG
jgi:uncharacterized protein YjaG (DUF416 family)